MLKLDAMQKYENALLENFSPSVLRELKRSNWSGLLREVDRLYSTMYHEWDSLQKDVVDIEDAVRSLTWTVAPYTRDGEEPGEFARQVASTVQDALWAKGEAELGGVSHSFTQLLGALCHHRFRGFNVHQIVWKRAGDLVFPAKYIQLPPQFMVWETKAGHPDRLLLVEDGMSADGVPFPKHQYIVALNTSGPDHPLYNATFYSLVNWFVAYKFGLGWFMEYAQKYGMPKQIIRYANEKERQQIVDDLSDESVLNTILLKEGGGRDFDFKYPTGGAASLPQAVLLQKAEEACHKAILGQTLTSDTSSGGGSLAQAKVHAGVQADVVMKVAESVADVLNQQLIPAILQANYGRVQGLPIPELRCKLPQAVASIERAQFLKTALEIPGMEVVKSEAYEYLNLTQPGEGDETFKAQDPQAQPPGGGFPGDGGGMPPQEPGGDEGSGVDALPDSAAKDEVVMSARRSGGDAQPDPAQAWLAPIKKKLREARAAGASLSELRQQIRAWKPDTRALANAMADNIAAGFKRGSEANDEEVRAENPYGCNQHGHGWVDPCPYGGGANGMAGKSALQIAGGAENVNPDPDPDPAKKAEEEKKKAEAEAAAKAEAERKAKEEEERKRKEEEERKRKEEEERKRKEEEERKRKEDAKAEAHKELKDAAMLLTKDYTDDLKAKIAKAKEKKLTRAQQTALAFVEKSLAELEGKIDEATNWLHRNIDYDIDSGKDLQMESLKKSLPYYVESALDKLKNSLIPRLNKLGLTGQPFDTVTEKPKDIAARAKVRPGVSAQELQKRKNAYLEAAKNTEKVLKENKGLVAYYNKSRAERVHAAINAEEAAKRAMLGDDEYFKVDPRTAIPQKQFDTIAKYEDSGLNPDAAKAFEEEMKLRRPIMKISLGILLGDGNNPGLLADKGNRILNFTEIDAKYGASYLRARMRSESLIEGTKKDDWDGRNHPLCALLPRSMGGAIHNFNTGSYGDIFLDFNDDVRERTTFTGRNSLDSKSIGTETAALLTDPLRGRALVRDQVQYLNNGGTIQKYINSRDNAYMEAQIRGLLTPAHIKSIGVPKKKVVGGWRGTPVNNEFQAKKDAQNLAKAFGRCRGKKAKVVDAGNHFLVVLE